MPTTPLDLQRQLFDFTRAFGLHQPDRTACGQPISTSEAHALTVLNDTPGIRMSDLARQLVLEKSSVTRLVQSMTERGWIRNQADRTDRRAKAIRLSPSGRNAAQRVARARSAHFEAVLDAIPPARREQVLRALDDLTRAARVARGGRGHAYSA